MSPPEATRPKTRSNTLRQVASTLFAFTTIVPLMIFVWTLYRLDALSKLEFQVDLGLALAIALLGFYIFRQLMGVMSDLIQIIGAAVERSTRQAAAARPPLGTPGPGPFPAPAPPVGATVPGGATAAPAPAPPAAEAVPALGPVQEVRELSRATALLWQAEADMKKGRRVIVSVMSASRPIPGKLVDVGDDGIVLEVEGPERITVSYKRISAIDIEPAKSGH
jgi:hypothetical protein